MLIKMSEGIRTFGFIEGIKFYLRMNLKDPIKIFYWKYIIAKPLCTNCGYFLCKPDCQYKKIIGRKNIIKYEKERHKQIEIESKTIRGSSDGICVYCGDEKGTEIIDDPNGTLERWKVCKTCEEVIKIQQELVFLSIMSNRMDNPKRAEELNNRLLEISKQTGKPITNIQINREADGYKASSTTFTGEK